MLSPKFVFYKNIAVNLFTKNCYNNRACIFEYKKYKIYIIYGVTSLDLYCYDCLRNYQFLLIKKLHQDSFDSCRHFYDSENNRDLIITSSLDRHVKVIDFKIRYSSVILDLNFEFMENVIINTSYFINNKIMIPFAFHNIIGKIVFYDIKGKKYYREIEDPGFVLCLNGYYNTKSEVYYALVSNKEGINVYNLNDYSLYNKFKPEIYLKNDVFIEDHVIEKNGKIILCGPCFRAGYLFFWDLMNKNLFDKIKLFKGITDICFWDNNYIFATLLSEGNKDKFALINLNSKKIEKTFDDIKDNNCYGIKILSSKFDGDFLITFSSEGKLYLYKRK